MLSSPPSRSLATSPDPMRTSPVALGPLPWHRLPHELTDNIFSLLPTQGLEGTVQAASQVCQAWSEQLAFAQPKAFSAVRQRAMFGLLEAAANEPVTERQRRVLSGYKQLCFDRVPKDGLEDHLIHITDAALHRLNSLCGPPLSVNLVGLQGGRALFDRWAQSGHLDTIEVLYFDRRQTEAEDFVGMLSAAARTPHLRTLAVAPNSGLAKIHRPVDSSSGDEQVEPEVPSFFDFSHLTRLERLDVHGCLWPLQNMRLDENAHLRELDVSGNPGADACLIGSGAPGPSLRALTVSPSDMNAAAFNLLQAMTCAPALRRLVMAGPRATVRHLDLRTMTALRQLDLRNQTVDYATLQLPSSLRDINLSQTGINGTNIPSLLSQPLPNLWRLVLHHNALTGILGELYLGSQRNLRVLDLTKSALRNEDLEAWQLPQGNRISHLVLGQNHLSRRALAALLDKPLPELRYLDMRMGSERDASSLAQVLMKEGPVKARWPKFERLAFNINWIRSVKVQHALQDFLAAEHIAMGPLDLALLREQDVLPSELLDEP